MHPNKFPDPDGFPVVFYQTYWELIKRDLVLMFQDFYQGSFDISQLNKVVICLIPIVSEAMKITDFRHINLLNCSYKIFTKVLANRF